MKLKAAHRFSSRCIHIPFFARERIKLFKIKFGCGECAREVYENHQHFFIGANLSLVFYSLGNGISIHPVGSDAAAMTKYQLVFNLDGKLHADPFAEPITLFHSAERILAFYAMKFELRETHFAPVKCGCRC